MKSKTTLLWLVLLLGFGGIWELQHAIDARRTALHQDRRRCGAALGGRC